MRPLRTTSSWASFIIALLLAQKCYAEARLTPELSSQVGPSGVVQSIAYSNDGSHAISADDTAVKLWDVATGVLLRTLRGHRATVRTVAFSPDGKRIASGGEDKTVRVWDAVTGAELRTIAVSSEGAGTIVSVAFAPDGQSIASGDIGGTGLMLWDATSGQVLRKIVVRATETLPIAFSPGGKLLAASMPDANSGTNIGLWDVSSGALIRSFSGHSAPISALAFSPVNDSILSASWDGTVKLWQASTGTQLRSFYWPSSRIIGAAFSPDGTRVVAGADQSFEGTLVLWSTATGELLHKSTTRDEFVQAMAISPDGKNVLSGNRDKWLFQSKLRRWDFETLAELTPLAAPAYPISSVMPLPNGALVTASQDGTLKHWDVVSGRLMRVMDATYPVRSAAVSSNGQRLVSGDTKSSLKIWDATTGAETGFHFVGFGWGDESILSVAFSPDSSRILTESGDKKVRLLDSRSGKPIRVLDGSLRSSLSFAPDGKVVASSDGSQIDLVDARSGRFIRSLNGAHHGIAATSFSPDGRFVASDLELWDATTGALVRSFDTNGSTAVARGAFSPDSRLFVWGDRAGTMKLWDVTSGRLIYDFATPGEVISICFSRDGRHIYAGGNDGLTRVWDVASGRLLVSIFAKAEGAWIAITPEGFFAGSFQDTKMLAVVRGFEVFDVQQFYQSLYRPDLVREKLAGDSRGLVRDAASTLDLERAVASGSAPEVRAKLSAGGTPTIIQTAEIEAEAEIVDRGGGIGRIEWRVNGVTVGIERSPGPGRSVKVKRSLSIDDGQNEISVVAYNGADLIASIPSRVDFTAEPPALPDLQSLDNRGKPGQKLKPSADARPRMFVLAAGVNRYADERIALANAVADAREVARALKEAGALYRTVEVELLVDAEVTSEKLETAFIQMGRRAKSDDVFVLYLAGHGKTIDGRYYFAPQPLRIDGEISEPSIRHAVLKAGISQEFLQRGLTFISARRSLLLFDTCDSGTLVGDFAETQGLERAAANDRLAQATGRSIITASAGIQEAQDGYRGHGLFTYEMLSALGRADSDDSGTVELNELAAYVHSQVIDLSVKIFKKPQVPHIKLGADYQLARKTIVIKDETPSIAATKQAKIAQVAQLQTQPFANASTVRSLNARTKVTVIDSKDGWSLVGRNGRPIGYVATRDLVLSP